MRIKIRPVPQDVKDFIAMPEALKHEAAERAKKHYKELDDARAKWYVSYNKPALSVDFKGSWLTRLRYRLARVRKSFPCFIAWPQWTHVKVTDDDGFDRYERRNDGVFAYIRLNVRNVLWAWRHDNSAQIIADEYFKRIGYKP